MSTRITKQPERQQQRLRGFILIVGGLVLFSFLFTDPILRTWRKRDQIGAVRRQGMAVVTTLVLPRINETGDAMPALATVRYQGHIYAANHVYAAERLKVDAPAQIEYRVGKSGTIYLDAVEPLAPDNRRQATAKP